MQSDLIPKMLQDETSIRVLVFRLADHEHAVDVRQVKEILGAPTISKVIEAPDFVDGVIKLRGSIVPIVDLRKRLHLPDIQKSYQTCTIIVLLEKKYVGFVVDSASELLTMSTRLIKPPTEIVVGIRTRYIKGVAYLKDRFLVILDLKKILTIEENDLLNSFPEDDLRKKDNIGKDHREKNHRKDNADDWEDEFEEGQEHNLRKIVAFELDDELYGVDIEDVTEIMEQVPVTPLPNVPDFILGLINLRGSIVPVIDLRILFHLNRKDLCLDSRIIIMKSNEIRVGIIADSMWELLRLPPEAFQPPPPDVAKIQAEYFKEVSPLNERMLVVLDIKKILKETARKE